MAAAAMGPERWSRTDYGQRWGEGAARCFSLESDAFDDDETVRLTPIPECFICPMSQTPMEDPVMTVDGCVYERSYIEQWIRHRQQQRLRVTSPATNQELPSHRLVSLSALQKAIEAYLAHRPELRGSLTASRSFEEAAQMLQNDLLEKQAAHVGAEDELSLLRDSNEALIGALSEAERTSLVARKELDIARAKARHLERALEAEEASCAALKSRVEALEHERSKARARAPGGGLARAVFAVAVLAALAAAVVFARGPDAAWVSGPRPREAAVMSASLPPGAADAKVRAAAGTVVSSDVLDRGDALERGIDLDRQRVEEARRRAEEERIRRKIEHDKVRGMITVDGEPISRQVAMLRVGDESEKTQAALVLGILATASLENQVAIVRAGAVSPLVQLLEGEMPEARGQAAVALRALAANNTYNKVAVVRAGAIPALIRVLKEDAVEVQEVASAALQTLAETNNQVEIAQAGAIVPLVALLKDERSGVRAEAAGALVILSLNADNQVAIAQVGAVPLLVDLLRDDIAEVREQAAAALRNLAAENADNQAAIARAGAFTPLAELLKDDLPGVREEALAALRNLAAAGLEEAEAVAAAAAAVGVAIRESAGAGPPLEALLGASLDGRDAFPAAGKDPGRLSIPTAPPRAAA